MTDKFYSKRRFLFWIKLFGILMLSAMYANWLWDLPHSIFRDRDNYLIYASTPSLLIAQVFSSKSFLFKEPLFLLLNQGFLLLFGDPVRTINTFVFFITFATAFFSFFRTRSFLLGVVVLFFLFIQTQYLGMQLVTIRQGIGTALLLFLFPVIQKKYLIFLLFFICSLIHNSFYIITLFYIVYWILNEKLKIKSFAKKISIFTGFGFLFFSVFFTISKSIETKQNLQSLEESGASGSGGAFLMWAIILGYLLIFKRSTNKTDTSQRIFDLAIIGLVIYLTGYFLTPIVGRMIGIVIPFIAISLTERFRVRDLFFFGFVLAINFYLYFNGAFEGFLNVSLETFHHYIFSDTKFF
ncbi:EpsG family protein [Sphingobacterium sp. NGMCC 1.201703]|uniref:EpsG family protein n=1 Tax=Sphingobacterium sp. NGMCC 1.201703 TaxID=3388657 RepID=UPI0039FC71D9